MAEKEAAQQALATIELSEGQALVS
jgi:hypothetical protein